jgi:hypothetical protein
MWEDIKHEKAMHSIRRGNLKFFFTKFVSVYGSIIKIS